MSKVGFYHGAVIALLLVGAGATAQTPHLTGAIRVPPDGLRLSWSAEPGRAYRLVSSATVAGPWVIYPTTPELLTAAGNSLSHTVTVPTTPRFFRVIRVETDPAPAGMALVPAGTFAMGDSFGEGNAEERPVHNVSVRAFWMDQTEVTKEQWDAVRSWALANGYTFDNAGAAKAPEHPVHTINWHDAVKWCNARSEMEGRTPAYYTSRAQTTVYRTGRLVVENAWVKWDAGYRLPTEAEWERAARGGASANRFPWGDTIAHTQANYRSFRELPYDVSTTRGYLPGTTTGGEPYTSEAGRLPANAYELRDLTGNVWEWCWDWINVTWYSVSPTADPRGPESGRDRVLRGGAYNSTAWLARVSYRGYFDPGSANRTIGFRTVLPQGAP